MTEQSLRNLCEEAKHALNNEAYSEAIETARRILQHYPRHIESYLVLGQACLERGEIRQAVELFQRVLSADPENITAWLGLASAYEDDDLPDQTIWHLERAFELNPSDAGVREEILNLYARHHGIKEPRIKLNAAALGRLYLRGGLYHRAIQELISVLNSQPARVDIKASLAHAYWRAGKDVEAASVCQELLTDLPHCIQAHLILSEIWANSDQTELRRKHLAAADAIDPEHRLAYQMFGERTPLPLVDVIIPPYDTVEKESVVNSGQEMQEWLKARPGIPPPDAQRHRHLTDETPGDAELPDWLRPQPEPDIAASVGPEMEEHTEGLPEDVQVLVNQALESGAAVISNEADHMEKTAAGVTRSLEGADLDQRDQEQPIIPEADTRAPEEEIVEEALPDDLQVLVDRVLAEEDVEIMQEMERQERIASERDVVLEDDAESLPAWLSAALKAEELEGEEGLERPTPVSDSTPAKPSSKAERGEDELDMSEELPPWLHSLADETELIDDRKGAVLSGEGHEELPSWLAALVSRESEDTAEQLPAAPPSSELVVEDEIVDEETEGPAVMHDWLDELRRSTSQEIEETEVAVEGIDEDGVEAPDELAAPLPYIETHSDQERAPFLETEIANLQDTASEPRHQDIEDELLAATISSSMMEELVFQTQETATAEPTAATEVDADIRGSPAPLMEDAAETIQEDTQDADARLAIARTKCQAEQFDEATEQYTLLIQAEQHLDAVVEDLKTITVERGAGHTAWVLLGDAYMKLGHLSDALDAYRRALGR